MVTELSLVQENDQLFITNRLGFGIDQFRLELNGWGLQIHLADGYGASKCLQEVLTL